MNNHKLTVHTSLAAILLLSAGQLQAQATAYDLTQDLSIGSQAIAINNNNSSILTNSSGIATNSSDIAALSISSSDIANNSSAIVSNDSDIAANSSNIASNDSDIATNSSNIVTNSSDIAREVSDRNALIRREEDDFIHIGKNSFVLDDSVGAHRLTTDDGTLILGGPSVTTVDVDADLNVAGDIFASGDIFIGSNLGVQSQLDTNAGAIANNAGAIANNSNRIESNKKDIEQNTRGIAMVAALQHTTVLPGMNNAFDLSAAHFEGETGLALNYARRINENVQVNFGAASTTDFDESVIKAGIGVQW